MYSSLPNGSAFGSLGHEKQDPKLGGSRSGLSPPMAADARPVGLKDGTTFLFRLFTRCPNPALTSRCGIAY